MVDVAVCAGGEPGTRHAVRSCWPPGHYARRTAEVPDSLSDRRPAMASLPIRRTGRNQTLMNPTREFEDITG